MYDEEFTLANHGKPSLINKLAHIPNKKGVIVLNISGAIKY